MTVQAVCVGPGRNPNCWFSHAQAHNLIALFKPTLLVFFQDATAEEEGEFDEEEGEAEAD